MSRSSTRSATRPVAPAPQSRSLVRGGSGRAARYAVEFDARTAYDFLISLGIGGEDLAEITESDRTWLSQKRASLRSRAGEPNWAGTDTLEGLAGALTGIVVTHPEARSAADLIAVVDHVAVSDVMHEFVAHKEEALVPLLKRAAAGDPTAERELEREVGETHASAIIGCMRDPEAATGRLREVLHAWGDAFAEVEERVRGALERDVAGRQVDASTLDPGDLVERTTGGIRFVPDVGVRTVILAPSYFARPFNLVNGAGDWRLFCYPLADSALEERDSPAPAAATVRLYRALGDESRMRILKLLAERDLYLTEIAERIGLSKPTVSHHLAQLRAAGLVSVTDEGHLTYYSLKRPRLDDAALELHRYLG